MNLATIVKGKEKYFGVMFLGNAKIPVFFFRPNASASLLSMDMTICFKRNLLILPKYKWNQELDHIKLFGERSDYWSSKPPINYDNSEDA